MPRGAAPKRYPQEVVDAVRGLYARGLTQREVAGELGVSQKVIWNIMRRHGLRARAAAKSSRAGYAAERVERLRGTPAQCERCGASGPGRSYDWANLTGNHADASDYERMCRSCHRLYDVHR